VSDHGASRLAGGLAALAVAAGLYGTYHYTMGHREYPPEWTSYFEAADWLRRYSPQDALVMARKPFLLHLTSGRFTMVYPFTPDHEELVRQALKDRVDFVVVDRLGLTTTTHYLVPAIQAHRTLFEPMYATTIEPRTYIFRIRREAF
jgi:hypothetical protein